MARNLDLSPARVIEPWRLESFGDEVGPRNEVESPLPVKVNPGHVGYGVRTGSPPTLTGQKRAQDMGR